ncbi:MAG TPA: hypothetical protein VH817_20630 [Thermoleophilaceae bacterium]
MRRVRLRKPKAEPPPASIDDRELGEVSGGRDLIRALADAHRDGVVLVRGLLIAQEAADAWTVEADKTFRYAASHPGDERAWARAADARRRAVVADDEELRATERWATHLEQVWTLIALAEELCPVGITAGRPVTATRRSLRSGRRSRGHCSH